MNDQVIQGLELRGIGQSLETIPERKRNQPLDGQGARLLLANVWNIAATATVSELMACSFVHSDVQRNAMLIRDVGQLVPADAWPVSK